MPGLKCRNRKHLHCRPRTPAKMAMEWCKSENIGGIPRYVEQVKILAATGRQIRLGFYPLLPVIHSIDIDGGRNSELMHIPCSQPDENAPERAPSAYVLFSNSKFSASCAQSPLLPP